MLKVAKTNTIFRNPYPQLQVVDAWHPSLVHLDGERWFCSYDLAEAPEAHDYRTYCSVSSDDGHTWSQPTPIFPPAVHQGSSSMRVSKLGDGRLIGFGSLVEVRRENQGLLNPLNFGYAPMQLATTLSEDDGESWTPAKPMLVPMKGTEFETCHPIVELSDKRLLAPTSTWRRWNGEEPYGFKAIAFVSHDAGLTWPAYIDVRDDWRAGYANWEQSLVELRSGALVSLTWRYKVDSGETDPTEFAYSLDGTTFSPSRATGLFAQTSKMVTLVDDTVMVFYRRHDSPGLWATHAALEIHPSGATWNELDTTLVWNGASSGMESKKSRTAELSELKFGYPSPVLRPDGDVEMAYWRRVDDVNEISSVRISVS